MISLNVFDGMDVVPDSCPIVDLSFKEDESGMHEEKGMNRWILAFLGDYAR